MDLTKDTMIWPDLVIYQNRYGFRFSFDSILLARLIKAYPGDSFLDIGCGAGIVFLIVSRLARPKKIVGVEIQRSLYELCKKNVLANRVSKARIYNMDIQDYAKSATGKFDIIVSNPPYYPASSGRLNKTQEETRARHEIDMDLSKLLRTAASLMAPKGKFYITYPAQRAVELTSEMKRVKIEPKLMLPVYAYSSKEADLVWIKGISGGKSGIKLLKPLVCYEHKGRKTKTFEAFYKPDNKALQKLYPLIF